MSSPGWGRGRGRAGSGKVVSGARGECGLGSSLDALCLGLFEGMSLGTYFAARMRLRSFVLLLLNCNIDISLNDGHCPSHILSCVAIFSWVPPRRILAPLRTVTSSLPTY